jgi:glycosyltransferase involved in cell wall biosynthesis
VDVIGEGPERRRLEALVDELGLQDCVRLLGSLSHEESLARIAGARVFCLPARIAPDGDRDSMPVVIKEAMVREVPVVGTDIVGIPEMLDDGCGLLVPPDDPAALAAALELLLKDTGLSKDLATAARARVRERFAMAAEVEKLERVLLP